MDLTQQLPPNQPKNDVSNELPNGPEGFNWGAFFLSWIWGIGNNSIKAILLGLFFNIPLFTPIILGLKGNKWAWKNKHWNSVEEFRSSQKTWAIVGLLLNFFLVPVYIGLFSVSILASINPIEQTNKARDAKYKSDAAEILLASERYYSNKGKYPFVLGGEKVEVSTVVGELIQAGELRPVFEGKEMVVSKLPVDRMYIEGTKDSYKVCFTPKAASNKNLGQEMCVPEDVEVKQIDAQ